MIFTIMKGRLIEPGIRIDCLRKARSRSGFVESIITMLKLAARKKLHQPFLITRYELRIHAQTYDSMTLARNMVLVSSIFCSSSHFRSSNKLLNFATVLNPIRLTSSSSFLIQVFTTCCTEPWRSLSRTCKPSASSCSDISSLR